jgi:hypothetical protein
MIPNNANPTGVSSLLILVVQLLPLICYKTYHGKEQNKEKIKYEDCTSGNSSLYVCQR